MVSLCGRMGENTLELIKMTKNMGMENFNGQMVECIKEIGNLKFYFLLFIKGKWEAKWKVNYF